MRRPELPESPRATILWRLAATAWAVAALAGLGALGAHAARPGDEGSAAARWPASTRVPRADGRPSLVLFLDARCPCSSASLGELSRLLARAPGPVVASVVASGGAGDAAPPVAGAGLVADPRGEEAARFGAATSGHAMLFDADGRLAFSGGITPARGHRGDSVGARAILDRLAGRPAPAAAPVFGCPIPGPEGPEEVR